MLAIETMEHTNNNECNCSCCRANREKNKIESKIKSQSGMYVARALEFECHIHGKIGLVETLNVVDSKNEKRQVVFCTYCIADLLISVLSENNIKPLHYT